MQALFLGEAVLFGVFGVVLGIVGGVCLARFLLGREIARVISTLYLLVSVDRYFLTPLLVGSAFFFGLGSVSPPRGCRRARVRGPTRSPR